MTDNLQFEIQRKYTCLISPFLADDPIFYPLSHLPATLSHAIGHYEAAVWWETPVWWAGIVRELHWQWPPTMPVLAASTDLAARDWVVVETPVGDMLVNNIGNEQVAVGGVLHWSYVSWFGIQAIFAE